MRHLRSLLLITASLLLASCTRERPLDVGSGTSGPTSAAPAPADGVQRPAAPGGMMQGDPMTMGQDEPMRGRGGGPSMMGSDSPMGSAGGGGGMSGSAMLMGPNDMHGAECRGMATGVARPFSPTVRAAIDRALQEERRAEAGYDKASTALGEQSAFARISRSMERHGCVLENVYLQRGLTPPKDETSSAALPSNTKLADACAGGVASEKSIIATYDTLLETKDLPDDVRTAFIHLRSLSHDRDLPAFESCR